MDALNQTTDTTENIENIQRVYGYAKDNALRVQQALDKANTYPQFGATLEGFLSKQPECWEDLTKLKELTTQINELSLKGLGQVFGYHAHRVRVQQKYLYPAAQKVFDRALEIQQKSGNTTRKYGERMEIIRFALDHIMLTLALISAHNAVAKARMDEMDVRAAQDLLHDAENYRRTSTNLIYDAIDLATKAAELAKEAKPKTDVVASANTPPARSRQRFDMPPAKRVRKPRRKKGRKTEKTESAAETEKDLTPMGAALLEAAPKLEAMGLLVRE